MKLQLGAIFDKISLERKKISAFLLVVGTFIATLLISSAWISPTEARIAEYRHWQEMGIIDGVLSPSEAGLQYLQEDVPSIVGQGNILDTIRRVDRKLAKLPEDAVLRVPNLGSNSPVVIGRLPEDTGTPQRATDRTAVAYVAPNREVVPLTPRTIRPMVQAELRTGQISNSSDGIRNMKMIVADSSGAFLQAQRVPVVDIVVVDSKGRRGIIHDISINAFCRDVLNATLNGDLQVL